MKYFVTVIQKKAEDSYSNSIFRYDTLDAAKVKAYTELAYAFGSDLELGAVQITDDYLHVLFEDVYTKPVTTTTDTDTETDSGTSESGTATTAEAAAETETTGKA